MGKTARWFRSLLGYKKQPSDSQTSKKENNKRTVRSSNGNDVSVGRTKHSADAPYSSSTGNFLEGLDLDPSKHAIAVAAATAAVAEAAIAAAQAAAEVVRLTGGGSRSARPHAVSGSGDRRRELAAVKIQSAFRACLARRALRALKGLVRLQALVRGHIVRKQSADMLRRMQAMFRIQARASANRASMSESSHSSSKSFQSHNPGIATPMKYDHRQIHGNDSRFDGHVLEGIATPMKYDHRQIHGNDSRFDGPVLERCGSKPNIKDNVSLERMQINSNWLDHWMEETAWNSHRDKLLRNGHVDDEKADKILEIDRWPHLGSKRNDIAVQTSQHVSAWQHNGQTHAIDSLPRHLSKLPTQNPGLLSEEVSSLRSLKFPPEMNQAAVWTADNSPQVHTASSRPGSSSKRGPFAPAKAEYAHSFFGDYTSHPNYMANTESSRAKTRSQSAPRQRIQFERPASNKRFIYGLWDADSNSERGLTTNANFSSKAYASSVH